MAKRSPLPGKPSSALKAAAHAKEDPSGTATGEKFKTTGISFPPDVLDLLNDVAQRRKKTRGGRASVSAILLELVQAHREELEAEVNG